MSGSPLTATKFRVEIRKRAGCAHFSRGTPSCKPKGRSPMTRNGLSAAWLGFILGGLLMAGCGEHPVPGQVPDEAARANRDAASFRAADENYFRDMDRGIALTPDEVRGRNTWLIWTGGNDRFWDVMTNKSFGTFDLLKTVSSSPRMTFSRRNRWDYLGIVNEPCFAQPTEPDQERFGLWLDRRRTGPDCPPDPFADERKYPGVALGGRGQTVWNGKTLPVGSYYGEPTGIVGLRLFPNPNFDDAAARNWDPRRF